MTLSQIGALWVAQDDRTGPRYVPIVKSRQGELRALQELDDQGLEAGDCLPLIELVEVDFEGMRDDEPEIARGIDKLADKVAKAWPIGRPRVIIDTSSVELDTDAVTWDGHGETYTPDPVTPRILRRLLASEIRVVPTIRLSDQDRYVSEVRSVISDSFEPGACIRIGGEDLDDTLVPLEDAVMELLENYTLRPEQVDLVFDFGAVTDDETVATTSRLARFLLPALDQQPWRTFAVAAGGFPADLSDVPAYSITEVPRRDRALWLRVARATRLQHGLDYADYAVTHPRLQTGVAFAAPPQIRYATSESWLVSKGRRNDRRGHRQFFDLCGRLRDERPDDVMPPTASWGDEEFHTAASKAGSPDAEGMGNASTWRAISTSHHIAHVRSSLRHGDEP